MRRRVALVVAMLAAFLIPAGARAPLGVVAVAQEVGEKTLLDNDRLTMIEFVFPAAFKGEVEYASKGTVHDSLNETKRPARVLVVLLKER